MTVPPRDTPESPSAAVPRRARRPENSTWRRPEGVAPGTWRYVHEGAIAARYDEFVATTPLCGIDLEILSDVFPKMSAVESAGETAAEGAETPGQGGAVRSSGGGEKKWVFDLGCGTGRASAVLASNGYRVAAVDLSLPMLREVRKRDLESVATIQANLVQLDGIADHVAEGAVCLFSTLGMIQGRQNRRRFLAHVRRIVRRGGRFYLHVHHRYAALTNLPGVKQLVSTAVRSWTRSDWEYGDAVYAYRGLPDMFLHQFSRRELMADFAATGWNVKRWWNLSLDGSRVIDSKVGIAGGYLIVVG
ncbi:MAG: methyltransferase domain-containing protein [Rhodopirellula sp. JB044]|uniref:methyltransferase domain-containing protein n=1 Tax=Rhodopirellula sp. JB044 TaxID=3342844 RepID=UPI00370BE004